MALTARRRDIPDAAPGRGDGDDGAHLDERGVLTALEREVVDDAIEQTPRGIVLGSLFGLVVWAALIGIWMLFLA
jgi:hypothetical protein